MRLADFDSFFDNPSLLDTNSTALLKSILEEYPFCQSAHLLYARNLKNLQHIAYSSQLRIAAAYAGNRSLLKNFLHTDPKSNTPEISQTVVSEISINEDQCSLDYKETTLDSTVTTTIEQDEKPQPEALSKDEIISRFISSEPHITRPQKDFFNPVNYAKQSTVDNETIVSETLARILLKQGHTEKAIKVYEKLCLVFPEKSTYFANLIQKVKKEHK